MNPKPDAWAWEKYFLSKTASVWVTTVDHPETHAKELVENGQLDSISEINKVPETEEPLFSAETIQECSITLYKCSVCNYISSDMNDVMDCCKADAEHFEVSEVKKFSQSDSNQIGENE